MAATASIRYDLDEFNRLVVRQRDRATGAWLPPRVLEGRVRIDERNRFSYLIKQPSNLPGHDTPHAVHLDGAWRLTPRHELALALHDSGQTARQTLYLRGALIEAKANALIFALRGGETSKGSGAKRVSLAGRWRADARNRLNFTVEQADGSEDRLVLQGGWELGAHHELVYRYRQKAGAGRSAPTHALSFEGAWDITASNRLVYRFSGDSDAAFEFKAALQRPSLQAREGRIVYQVGIGLAGGRVLRRRVTLFGTWKLGRDWSITFEVPYAQGRVETIRFGGTYALTAKDRVGVALQNSRGEPLGITVTFTKELVPDASLFVRLRQDAEERSLMGGVQVKF